MNKTKTYESATSIADEVNRLRFRSLASCLTSCDAS